MPALFARKYSGLRAMAKIVGSARLDALSSYQA